MYFWLLLYPILLRADIAEERLILVLLHPGDARMKENAVWHLIYPSFAVNIVRAYRLLTGNTYHGCFCKGKLLTLAIIVRGTDITSEMCSGAHISRGNIYHCNTGPNEDKTLLQRSQRCHKGEFRHVSISTRQRSLWCGRNLRGPFLRATLPDRALERWRTTGRQKGS